MVKREHLQVSQIVHKCTVCTRKKGTKFQVHILWTRLTGLNKNVHLLSYEWFYPLSYVTNMDHADG